jgi:hypothetical protein
MLKKIDLLFIFFIFLIISSCNVKEDIKHLGDKNIIFNEITFDTIIVSLSSTSSLGHFEIVNGNIVFFDHEFAVANVLNEDFIIEKAFIGFGRGPNEITGIHKVAATSDSSIVILNTDWSVFKFNNNWEKINTIRINQSIQEESLKRAVVFPNSSMVNAYEYEPNGISIKMLNEYTLLIPVTTFGIVNEFGEYGLANKYYRDYFALGRVNMVNGLLDTVFLKRPAVYLEKKNRYLSNFNFFDFDLHQNNYWISWAIDSLIYQYKYPDELICAFGHAGAEMDVNYQPYKKFDDHEKNFFNDRKNYGYYNGVLYDEYNGLIYRSYYKGYEKGYGMQVYKDYSLIADVEVPDNFRLLGRIGDHLIANGTIDEYNGTAFLYRFKIP